MKFYQLKRSFFRKTSSNKPLYKLSAGRSMVEMLGVLAIIGVLSVGAISGYSKAMTKYKLNKYSESINLLINNYLYIKDQLPHSDNGRTYYGEILQKLNLIPDNITYYTSAYLQDIFGNYISVFNDYYGADNYHYGIIFQLDNSKQSLNLCKSITETVKANSPLVYQFYFQPMSGGGSYYTTYGDGYCTGNRKCLKNLTITDIDDLCSTYTGTDNSVNRYVLHLSFK